MPTAVPEATDSFKVLVPLDAMLVGVKLAVTPFASPVTESAMDAWNPFTGAVVSVIVFEPPAATLAVLRVGVSVKLGVKTIRLSV